ncbi:MAG: 6-phosphofructokinase [Candidatus Acidiferrales bacterium]|jgi:6-phosphofructokinase 1
MAQVKKIGILTGGGDVPGLNSVIKSAVYRGSEFGMGVVGIRRGWKGLTHLDPANIADPTYTYELTRENTLTIDRTGGTILHTSRTNPRRMAESKIPEGFPRERLQTLGFDGKYYDFTPIVIENLQALSIDCLIAIGGDDTLSFASILTANGFPVIGVPKTMDNDVQGTEYCIGFSTAVTRARDAITRQRTTIGSHERIGIFRIFGRDAGFTAVYTAYVTGSRCLIPEYPFDLEHAISLLLEDKRNNPSGYSLVVVSEGAVWKEREVQETGEADAFGHRKKVDIGQALSAEIQKRTGEETIASDLTYDLRGGAPDVIDQIVGGTFGNIAVDLIHEGVSGRMIGILNGVYTHTPLSPTPLPPRRVDTVKLYNTERYRPNYASKLGLPLLFGF